MGMLAYRKIVGIFICFVAIFFSQNLTLGYMTRTLKQIIFFFSTKIRIFFSATLGIRIFFFRKFVYKLGKKWQTRAWDPVFKTAGSAPDAAMILGLFSQKNLKINIDRKIYWIVRFYLDFFCASSE